MRSTTLVTLLSLPLLINAGIAGLVLSEQKAKQAKHAKCEYVPEERSYSCKNIIDKFPDVFYGNYHLKCADCVFTTFRKETFPHNNDLISMNLTGSNIRTISKEAFHRLTALQYIYLQHNHMQHIEEGAFYGLRQVFELHLDENELKDLKRGFMNGFESNSVFLGHNLLEEIPANVFEGIFGVMTLDLSHNKIFTLHVNSFRHLKGLEYLDLQHNKLCRLPLGVFQHLRLLKDLNLSHNNFKQFQVGAFSGLPNLYALNLSRNDLIDVHPSMLTSLENLSLLDVTATGIDYVDAMEIHANAPQLKHIGLAENRWNCHVLQNIVQYLRTKQITVIEHDHYEVTNIKGIACAESSITDERIPFDMFFKYVKQQTAKVSTLC